MSEDRATDDTAEDDRLGGFVGDGREKWLVAHTRDGERLEYGDVYVKHAAEAYVVSDDPAFPPGETERLAKADLLRVEVDQHHSTCFITTAAGDESDLAVLRRFRDETLTRTWGGRVLVTVYERVSPPVARTLAAYPGSLTRRVVARLVGVCAGLARRQQHAGPARRLVTLLLVVLYAVGLGVATAGHGAIRLRHLKKRSRLSRGR